jgi:hypothetical protein
MCIRDYYTQCAQQNIKQIHHRVSERGVRTDLPQAKIGARAVRDLHTEPPLRYESMSEQKLRNVERRTVLHIVGTTAIVRQANAS